MITHYLKILNSIFLERLSYFKLSIFRVQHNDVELVVFSISSIMSMRLVVIKIQIKFLYVNLAGVTLSRKKANTSIYIYFKKWYI